MLPYAGRARLLIVSAASGTLAATSTLEKTNPAAKATPARGVAFQSGVPFHEGCHSRPATAIVTRATQQRPSIQVEFQGDVTAPQVPS